MAKKPRVYYSDALGREICERLSTGESLRSVCRSEGMPTEAAVRMWAIDDLEGFYSHYARARDVGLDCMADKAMEVAETPKLGKIVTTKPLGTEISTRDTVDRSRLHVDTIKWYLSKLAPKRYGEKLALEHSGEVNIGERLIAARKRTGTK